MAKIKLFWYFDKCVNITSISFNEIKIPFFLAAPMAYEKVPGSGSNIQAGGATYATAAVALDP